MHLHCENTFACLGIYKATWIKPFLDSPFLSEMKADELKHWLDKHGKSSNASLHDFILNHVGKSIDRMLRYVAFRTTGVYRISCGGNKVFDIHRRSEDRCIARAVVPTAVVVRWFQCQRALQ